MISKISVVGTDMFVLC